ncbi:phosphotransferase family protein [Microlunatus speluncae]|uniref:phosphotransferase family protein n=1 Tax=Microlunatus speluncae TaxID=2594267 RepID=UPI0012661037|nr:phosphotransferase [Microlunatus speluncae]
MKWFDSPQQTLPTRPAFRSRSAYVESLHDVEVWRPYVSAILARHRLPEVAVEAGFVGKYATFLVGDVVVKLFGRFPSWSNDHAVELFMQLRVQDQDDIPAPRLLGYGSLYPDEPEPWPYLITDRLRGRAWRDVPGHAAGTRSRIAGRLGEITHSLHGLPAPAAAPFENDWLTRHGADCATRLTADGTLPPRLLEQVGDYLAPVGAEQCLTHGDLTEDHLFLDRGALTGIIDWGDAQATDPFYDLPPLFLGAFGGDRSLLRAFLTGYGWPVDDPFCHRALSITLMHRKAEFLVRRIGAAVDLSRFATLSDLAEAVWVPE